MLNNINTIEDCLVSFATSNKDTALIPLILPEDQILLSLARQIKRNVGLTNKQYDIARDRIKKYEDKFVPQYVLNLDSVLNITRIPMRVIDREKAVTLCYDKFKSVTSSAPWIKIKFPFNRTVMLQLQKIVEPLARDIEYFHEKGTHEHYVKLTETNIEKIMTIFGKKDFYIEPAILELYESINDVKNNPEKFIPGIFNDKLLNVPQLAVNLLQGELGDITPNTRLLYRDRSLRYGINYYDYTISGTTMSEKIALRTKPEIAIENSNNFSKIIESLVELRRAPILVTVNDLETNILNETSKFYNEFIKYFPNNEQSVLFRVDNIPNVYTVNNFIKDNFLNNWVDEHTKVVYIKKSALPKILLTGVWKPITTISMDIEVPKTTIKEYTQHYCDLIVYYDSENAIAKSHRKERFNVIM